MAWSIFAGKKNREKKRLKKEIDNITRLLREQDDARNRLKQQIVQIQNSILTKKPELEAAKGEVRKVVESEIIDRNKRLQKILKRNTIISKTIQQLDSAQLTLEELLHGTNNVSAEFMDNLFVQLDDLYAEIKETGIAAKGLETLSFDDAELSVKKQSTAENIIKETAQKTNTAPEQTTNDEINKIFAELE